MRHITIPALYAGQQDAQLAVDSDDGEIATITLETAAGPLARGEGFRRPEIGPHTWHDAPEAEIAGTFGAFLSHAIESSDDDARAAWSILRDDASDWTDALACMEDDGQL